MKKIKSALVSVFYKDGLDEIVKLLDANGVEIYSTGGTYDYICNLGIEAKTVEGLTGYPSILGGRVKTLHPKVFGGILARRDNAQDMEQSNTYEIPQIDLVIVDLYPFKKTVESGASEADIIEKIDIGGISLIRAAAKNYKDVLIVPSVEHYAELMELLSKQECATSLEDRFRFATYAFAQSSDYDTAIFGYFNQKTAMPVFKQSYHQSNVLRYGENPHQKGYFYGDLESFVEQLHGKEISYNNIGDIDAACRLIDDFEETTFAIIKHNNACGLASRPTLKQAYADALAGDPVSAFGGVLVCNRTIDKETAELMNSLFMEICIAPDYSEEALEILKCKKNRILLKRKDTPMPEVQYRSALNGILVQDADNVVEKCEDLKSVTSTALTEEQKKDLIFANKIVKHTKSNAIVLAKNQQLCASGTGQTSRVDALRQAIEKAKGFGFDLQGAVMASDAFFPFPDCVEIASKEGINAVIQPGGSVKDDLSIEFCENNKIAMAMTGNRHFKH
ncbi:MAG: bifunctional phosphoribosylaminoimidazolecarboxamide formyltransferase/IMP cyclohydrolase [Bacteroidales bacterium]|nr:bifunctional phosphoribosylaminoimidazolecarboxamide formyltransferase/IMP cyclohydrolase [Bacteroidales bacterium]MBO7228765.1 bifunctional phosphoribosylaminoimidazolecarboxamide formyltransferase/IMP cyclohydrolase [Bacteroidales bacterium]